MICSFLKKQDVIEVIVLSLEQHEVTDDYILKVMGMDAEGCYTNSGYLELSEEEIKELISSEYLQTPKEIIGKRLAVVSNAVCKEAGIQHLNTTITNDEWQALQPHIKENSISDLDRLAHSDGDMVLEF